MRRDQINDSQVRYVEMFIELHHIRVFCWSSFLCLSLRTRETSLHILYRSNGLKSWKAPLRWLTSQSELQTLLCSDCLKLRSSLCLNSFGIHKADNYIFCMILIIKKNLCKQQDIQWSFLQRPKLENMLSHFSHVWLFVTLWAVVRQAPLSIVFSRQESWTGFPCPPPRNLPDPGLEHASLCLLHQQVGSLPPVLPGKSKEWFRKHSQSRS